MTKEDKKEDSKIEYQKYYDEDGNEIKALSKEKASKLLKKNEEEKKELEEKYNKLQDKDYNFKKLREAKKEEKEKMLEKMDEKEKKFYEEIEANRARNEKLEKRLHSEHFSSALDSVVGADEDLRKKVKHNYDRIKDEANTKEEIRNKVVDAYKMSLEGDTSNPIESASATKSSGSMSSDKGSSKISSDVKKFGKEKLNLSDEDLKRK